jgi:hypothetical protein
MLRQVQAGSNSAAPIPTPTPQDTLSPMPEPLLANHDIANSERLLVFFGEEPLLRNRFQVGAGGAIDHMTEAIEAGAVAGAVPRLFGGVPVHDAFQVRTDGRKPMQSS